MLDIGGGFPAPYADPVPDLHEIACRVLAAVDELPYRPPALIAEPGRYLVAESGVLIASVLLVQERADGRWVFVDVSGYHGLMEAVQTGGRWRFPVWTSADGQAGDKVRVRSRPVLRQQRHDVLRPPLPATLREGDLLVRRLRRAPTRSATQPTSTASHPHSCWKPATISTDPWDSHVRRTYGNNRPCLVEVEEDGGGELLVAGEELDGVVDVPRHLDQGRPGRAQASRKLAATTAASCTASHPCPRTFCDQDRAPRGVGRTSSTSPPTWACGSAERYRAPKCIWLLPGGCRLQDGPLRDPRDAQHRP